MLHPPSSFPPSAFVTPALPAPDWQPSPASTIAALAILVVDDDKTTRHLLRLMLEHAGFKVVMAANGRQALKSFQEREIAAVVTDIMMPSMDGLRLIRELLAFQPGAPIVAISGADVRLEIARPLGAQTGVPNPVRCPQVVQAVPLLAA